MIAMNNVFYIVNEKIVKVVIYSESSFLFDY